MTQLYNRTLFTAVDGTAVTGLLDDAIAWLEATNDALVPESKTACLHRLRFRRSFLLALTMSACSKLKESGEIWEGALQLFEHVVQTTSAGTPVPESFSVKIYRKLASAVPPKPLINLETSTAFTHLRRLCQDGRDIAEASRRPYSSNEFKVIETSFQARVALNVVPLRLIGLFADAFFSRYFCGLSGRENPRRQSTPEHSFRV